MSDNNDKKLVTLQGLKKYHRDSLAAGAARIVTYDEGSMFDDSISGVRLPDNTGHLYFPENPYNAVQNILFESGEPQDGRRLTVSFAEAGSHLGLDGNINPYLYQHNAGRSVHEVDGSAPGAWYDLIYYHGKWWDMGYHDSGSGSSEEHNAFSVVSVPGQPAISADSATDTLTLEAGDNVTILADAESDKVTISATDTTYDAATQSEDGLMSAADKTKLDGIATGANKYSLPVATSSALGGVKSGTDITVDSSGNVSVNNHLKLSGGTMTGNVKRKEGDYVSLIPTKKYSGYYLQFMKITYVGANLDVPIEIRLLGRGSHQYIIQVNNDTGSPNNVTFYTIGNAIGGTGGIYYKYDSTARTLSLLFHHAGGGGWEAAAVTDVIVPNNHHDKFTFDYTVSEVASTEGWTKASRTTFHYAISERANGDGDGNIITTTYATKTELDGKAESSHTHTAASSTAAGFMSTADKAKLDGIAAGANKYSLPVATSSALGGVKSGTDITVDSSGNVSVNDNSHNHFYEKAVFYGASGTWGVINFCTITVNSQYQNEPFSLELSSRNRLGTLTINLSLGASTTITAPSLVWTSDLIEAAPVWYKVDGNKLYLYWYKSEAYDEMSVTGLNVGVFTYKNVTFSWGNTYVTATTGLTNVPKSGYKVTCGVFNSSGSSIYTIDSLWGSLLNKTGTVGSVYLNKKSSGVGSDIVTGWYNFIYMPHGNGLGGGDYSNYGSIILTPMTVSSSSWALRVTNNSTTVSEAVKLSKYGISDISGLQAALDGKLNKRCGWCVTNVATPYWFCIAEYTCTSEWFDMNTTFIASYNFYSQSAIVTAKMRQATMGVVEVCNLTCISKEAGFPISQLAIAYKGTSGDKSEFQIWAKCASQYQSMSIMPLYHGTRDRISNSSNYWTLNQVTHDHAVYRAAVNSDGLFTHPNGFTIKTCLEPEYATKTYLTDGSVTKVGTSTLGSDIKPIYLSSGVPTAGSTYAGGTAVTLNGTDESGSTAAFYAPTNAQYAGWILISNGKNLTPVFKDALQINGKGRQEGENNSYSAVQFYNPTCYRELQLVHGGAVAEFDYLNYSSAAVSSTGTIKFVSTGNNVFQRSVVPVFFHKGAKLIIDECIHDGNDVTITNYETVTYTAKTAGMVFIGAWPYTFHLSSHEIFDKALETDILEITDSNLATYYNSGTEILSGVSNIISTIVINCSSKIKISAIQMSEIFNGKRVALIGEYVPSERYSGYNSSVSGGFSSYLYTHRPGSPNSELNNDTVIRGYEDFIYFNGKWYGKGY